MMTVKYLAAAAAIALSLASATGASAAQFWNETAPTNGGNGEVVSPNALPPGFMDGTEAALHAQNVARWFGAQTNTAYATAPLAQQPNG